MNTPNKGDLNEVGISKHETDTTAYLRQGNWEIVRTAANGRNVVIRGCSPTLLDKLNHEPSTNRKTA